MSNRMASFGAWLKSLPRRVAENVVISILVAAVLGGTVWAWLAGAFRTLTEGDASVAAWVLPVGLLGIFTIGLVAGFLLNRRREANPIAYVAQQYQFVAHLHAGYAEHLSRTLEQMQDAITGALPGVSLEQFIERGILEPGRDMLMQSQRTGEDVRLSILQPDGEDFVMTHAAGHTPEGFAKFRIPIAESFSRHAYEQGVPIDSPNLQDDGRFEPHPKGKRPYGAMVSVPLRGGGQTIGTFNAVFTSQDSYDVADYLYIALLAAISGVALATAETQRVRGGP